MRKVYLIAGLLLACALLALGGWLVAGKPKLTTGKPSQNANATATLAFGVIGDNEGPNATYDNLMRQLGARADVQFILHLGDALENGTAAEWQALLQRHTDLGVHVPVYFVPGNHDITDDPDRTAFAAVNHAAWRSVDAGNVHLVLLDNADRKVGFPAAELTWLEADLQHWTAQKQAGDVCILAYHRPFAYPFADLLGDDETKTSRKSNDAFLAILAKYPVNHVYAGHVHTLVDYDMVTARDSSGAPTQTVPVTVSGGGGGDIQSAFGGLLRGKFHALVIQVRGSRLSQTVLTPT